MSDTSQGEGWWMASDNKWYAPEQHPDYVAPVAPVSPPAAPVQPVPDHRAAAETQIMSAPSAAPGPTFSPASATTQTYAPGAGTDPDYNLPASEPASSKRGLVLGVGALVLVVGLGFLAFRFFGGSAGGADSPEAAVDQLITSINERDAVGFVDVFDPDEIDAWFGSFAPAFAEFETPGDEGGATNDISQAYASVFSSFDYTLTGPGGEAVTYQVEPLDRNGRISRVRIEGLDFELMLDDADTALILGLGSDPSATDISQLDGTRAEFRDEPGGLAARLFVPGGPNENEFAPDVHLDLVTVQKDGKWFVSLGYSFLEQARNQGELDGLPDPDFGRAFALVEDKTGGADSPESVVETLFTAIETLDYETIIQVTDPYGTPYLHDYQPLIDAEVDETERREAVSEARLRFDELELGTSEWEGRTLVTTRDISATGNGGFFNLDTVNWCVTFEDQFDSGRACLEDGIAELLFQIDSDLDPRELIPDEAGLIVVERNGRWYLDPLGTLGFYADQIAEAGSAFVGELDTNPATELGDIFVFEGPIARRDMPAIAQAESGSAGVALDLSGYPTIDTDIQSFHVAVARVVTDQPGSFVSYDNVPLTGEDWVAVYMSSETDNELPAIATSTGGTLDVELFEVQVTEVGDDGFSGQLGGQGRPQIFVLSDGTAAADVNISGVSARAVSPWESRGVVLPRSNAGSFLGDDSFVVVYGEPGARFTIDVDVFAPPPPQPTAPPAPVPTPAPPPERSLELGDPVANAFADLVEPFGYDFLETQVGGYFDGCGGPNDPDVTSYVFQGNGNLVVTPYPDPGRAEFAFDNLVNVTTPCDAFPGTRVLSITTIDIDNIVFEWDMEDGSLPVIYEHYRLVGDTIVVASNSTLEDLDNQLVILDGW